MGAKPSMMTLTAYTVGLLPGYYIHMRFIPSIDTDLDSPNTTRWRDLESLAGYHQWPKVLTHLKRQWAMTCTSCMFVASLSIAFLQIGGVIDNVAERTLALAAFMSAGNGLINSAIYFSLRLNMDSVEFRNRWMEASQNLLHEESIIFWVSLMSPIISLVWSIIFSIFTAFIFAWLPNGNEQSDLNASLNILDLIGRTFLTVLLLGNLFQIYCTAKVVGFQVKRWR